MGYRQATDMLVTAAAGAITTTCILDNSKSPTAKSASIDMTCSDGTTKTLVEDYLPQAEAGIVDLRSLHIQVTSFSITWKTVPPSGPGGVSGLIAAPGSHFTKFGIRWDEHDHASVFGY